MGALRGLDDAALHRFVFQNMQDPGEVASAFGVLGIAGFRLVVTIEL